MRHITASWTWRFWTVMKVNWVIFVLLAIIGLLLWAVMHTMESSPRLFGPLPHECYVWQRVWNEELRESIGEAESSFEGFTILAAEIDVRPERLAQQIMPVDYSFLSTLSIPVGIAIRINPYSGPFEKTDPSTQSICQIIRTVLKTAADAGFNPVEIQIDYDCAESKLAGYRTWVECFKETFPQYPITITALPSWMNNGEFKKLVQSSDGYILQVHSLERPDSFEDEVVLCDPKSALKWIKKAERFDVPYRVALPTYGYIVAYDEQGKFFGLSAEGPMPGWPENTQIKTVLSDAKKISSMIQEVRALSPKHLTGIIWFRLPVSSDQLNWQWHTLERVIQEQPLTERIEAVIDWPQSNLAEVYLVNSGDVDISVPVTVSLDSGAGDCLAADGLKGYTVHEDGQEGTVLLYPDNVGPVWRIRAQEKVKIAWCRFDKETEVKANVQFE